MTTFTKVLINPARRQGRKYLTNPHALHAAVAACFPPDLGPQGRILWRLDQRGHEHVLYMVGPEKPTANHIVDEAGWEVRPAQTADYDRFVGRLMRGQRWNFELLANPTHSQKVPGKERGKVVAHIGATAQLNWLLAKTESIGVSFGDFETPSMKIVERSGLDFFKPSIKNPQKRDRVHLVTARFKGELEVVDPERLRSALLNGIGRGKGYGCGLLTLASPTLS